MPAGTGFHGSGIVLESARNCSGNPANVTEPQLAGALPVLNSGSHDGNCAISHAGASTPGVIMSWTVLCAADAAAKTSSRELPSKLLGAGPAQWLRLIPVRAERNSGDRRVR